MNSQKLYGVNIMSFDQFDKLVDDLHSSPRKSKKSNPVPPHLRHTSLNRNPNSNNRHLIRDPLNNIYHWYTTTDIIKLFNLSRQTVLRHVELGLLNPNVIDNQKHYNRRGNDNTTLSIWLIFPATTIYSYCTTYHNIIVKSSSPPYIPPAVEASARSFVNEYLYTSGSFQPREIDLDLQGNVPILPYGSKSYTLQEYKALSKAAPKALTPSSKAVKKAAAASLSEEEKADREERSRARRETAYEKAYSDYYSSIEQGKPKPLQNHKL